MFEIEKNVPTPKASGGYQKYPFRQMEIGDSFAVPREAHLNVARAASWAGNRQQKKFSIRKHGDAYRCWRVS